MVHVFVHTMRGLCSTISSGRRLYGALWLNLYRLPKPETHHQGLRLLVRPRCQLQQTCWSGLKWGQVNRRQESWLSIVSFRSPARSTIGPFLSCIPPSTIGSAGGRGQVVC